MRGSGKEKVSRKLLLALSFAAVLSLMLFVGCGSGDSHDGEAQAPLSAKELAGRDYQDVVVLFETAGFSNIELVALGDLVTGWLRGEGEVKGVSINGTTDFSSGKWFPEDALIRITYHSFPEREPEDSDSANGNETQEEQDEQEEQKEQEEQEGQDTGLQFSIDSLIEEHYTVAYGELTGRGFTIEWIHNYTRMDFTGEIMYLIENPGSEFEIPWLVVGYEELNEKDKTVTLLIDNQENMDRLADADATKKALEAKLSPPHAWTTVQAYGKAQFPNGFKLHYTKDKLAETAENKNTWFLKATCDVTDDFGKTHKGKVCEARVTGTTDNPKVTYFIVY